MNGIGGHVGHGVHAKKCDGTRRTKLGVGFSISTGRVECFPSIQNQETLHLVKCRVLQSSCIVPDTGDPREQHGSSDHIHGADGEEDHEIEAPASKASMGKLDLLAPRQIIDKPGKIISSRNHKRMKGERQL